MARQVVANSAFQVFSRRVNGLRRSLRSATGANENSSLCASRADCGRAHNYLRIRGIGGAIFQGMGYGGRYAQPQERMKIRPSAPRAPIAVGRTIIFESGV